MSVSIRATLDPNRYHGADGRRPFFEGWYYKLIDRGESERYAVIPGIFRGVDLESDHAFVQILDGSTGRSAYVEYPAREFTSSSDSFEISIGPNRFTSTSIQLDIESADINVNGCLDFTSLSPWPVSVTAPGIMGWYAWVPFMQCYHGVVSLDHGIAGNLAIDGKSIDFGGGRGYTEKDWGRAFPSAWVWCQCNHFGIPATSLTASVAVVPWLRGSFAGLVLGLQHDGTLYRFASYTGARIDRLEIGDSDIYWAISDRRHRLDLHLSRASGGLLRAPTGLDMGRRIAETLDARVHLNLSELTTGRSIVELSGHNAGLEVAGDLPNLIDLCRTDR